MTIEEIKAEIKERLAQTNVKREEQESKVEIPDYFSGLFDGVANGFDQVLVLLDQLEPSWHEYPEEKPESGLYRVTLDVSPFAITRDLYYNSVTGLWENPRSGCEIVLDVIAWAELPKPYKKEDAT